MIKPSEEALIVELSKKTTMPAPAKRLTGDASRVDAELKRLYNEPPQAITPEQVEEARQAELERRKLKASV